MLQLFSVTVYGTRYAIFHDKHFVLLLYLLLLLLLLLLFPCA